MRISPYSAGFLTIAALTLAGAALPSHAQNASPNLPKGIPSFCANNPTTLCSTIPTQIGSLLGDYNGLSNEQTVFDNFAWQMFVALNWPSDAKGSPIGNSFAAYPNAKRVWEHFPSGSDVYGGGKPVGGCQDRSLPTFSSTSKSGFITQTLAHSAAAEGILGQLNEGTGEILQATGQPLFDRNGNYVLYDIRVSQDERSYIQQNGLTSKTGQQNFKKNIIFPTASSTTPGAIEVKTSWRILPSADAKYYSVKAQISLDGNETLDGKPACLPVTLGLVGMHIAAKPTGGYDQNSWIWATFEHKDNAPLATDAAQPVDGMHSKPSFACNAVSAKDAGATAWSFYNPSCTKNGQSCPVNEAPPKPASGYKWNTSGPPYVPADLLNGGKYGTQVARCWAIYTPTQVLNAVWANKIRSVDPNSPWQNYNVVSTQWVANQLFGESRSFDQRMVPRYLSNTTMETYIQPQGSCMSCHQSATDLAGKNSNFSFFLLNASTK